MNRRDFSKASLLGAAGLGLAPVANAMSRRPDAAAPCTEPPFPDTPGLTRYVGEFILATEYDALPEDVIALGKKSILDGLGLALAGTKAPTGPLVAEYLAGAGRSPGDHPLLGTNLKASARGAAFANGVSIHAHDFDDTQLSAQPDRVYGLLCHPTAPVLPTVLALAGGAGHSGRQFMLAYHIGVEVECKIAEAIAPRHYIDGFHTTGTCGTFGGAAASAKLLGLQLDPTLRALGIAASEGAGLRENFGTMTKPFHAGRAAENGLVAAELAAIGWTASERILEAPLGFFHAEGGGYTPAFLLHKLGHPWTIASPGISIKPFPSGSLTHPAMGVMQQLIAEHHIQASQVERVDIGTNDQMPKTLLHHDPHTGLQAKFSMEFCLAILLLEHKAGLAQFTDAVVQRPDVQAMIQRVHFYTDPIAEAEGYAKMTSLLAIHMKDGKVYKGRADFAKGSPANPMSYDEVADKFYGCADYAGWDRGRAQQVVAMVAKLEQQPSTAPLLALLSD
ncbi:MAG TPA: MmgE/PrpD family protein [Terriglobales bacterium]|nr:MmgE/PrpD family protein [Terriglobales bacterium]